MAKAVVKPKVFTFHPVVGSLLNADGGDGSDDEIDKLVREEGKPSIEKWLNSGSSSKSAEFPNFVSSRELLNFPFEAVGTDPIPLEPIDTASIDCDHPLLFLFGEIIKPTEFYFQIVNKLRTLEKVMEEMDKYYGLYGKGNEWLIPQKHLVPGLHVAAPYYRHDDFHRAKILKLNETNTIAQDLTNLAPRKPDWDLKRDVAKKLEKLERRTQRAIAELIRERLKAGESGGDFVDAVNQGVRADIAENLEEDEET
ncbi:unnamed protein product [Cyprideis torosa]|uniref:Uncharacterized protein n=1 Tax=Cyprideis torosa TaxID=163714 RepID=A0A7R8ZH35_9CRUS|nr:unnamed protein product [Cyprideis torosa]CAG0882760.1 unnamed protein product [Cyprideis torosa]